MLQPELSGEFATLMEWADAVRRMKVRTNADTPADAAPAREFGAEGIGLCRTEHMFFEEDRIVAMREMILADDEKGRRAALAKLLPMQREDFVELFEIMAGLPVTIRLLDPPLHEFLPQARRGDRRGRRGDGRLAREAAAPRAPSSHEFNPMLGFRGCRLAIAYPEIAEMQARAIFEAALEAARSTGAPVVPEIMVPLVATKSELDLVKGAHRRHGRGGDEGGWPDLLLPGRHDDRAAARRASRADEIAESAEFFSFGTNDLTQTTIGITRDDAAAFLGTYVEKGIFAVDPFVSIDQEGVGELVRLAVRARPGGAARTQARHLRRAWRRPGLDRLLREGRPRLRLLLALPRADRPPRRGAGGVEEQGES